MKIGIDVRLWEETGVGRYIRNLISELVTLDTSNEYVLFANTKDTEALSAILPKERFKIVTTDIRWHSLQEQMTFATALNAEELDLMHFPYFSLPIAYSRPFIVTIHDLIIHHFATGKASTLPLPLYYLKRFGYARVLNHGVTKAKRIIVPLESVKKDVESSLHVPSEKIVVTLEGFDTALTTQAKEVPELPFERYFLYVGNAYPHKNLSLLLKGFRLFQERYPNTPVGLLLVGKDDMFYARLKEEVAKNGDTMVMIRNNVSDSELAFYYQEALCLVSPSLMEGFGLTSLEAIALSCLPVLSDIPAFHEVCGDGALYFDPNSPESLCEKLHEVISMDEEERKRIKAAGKSRLGNFSWRKMAEETLALYNDLQP